jgi:hypothetical protein
VVVEAGGDDLLNIEIGRQVMAWVDTPLACGYYNAEDGSKRILEDLVLIHNLDAMLVILLGGGVAHGGEMGVHHERRCGGMLDIAGTAAIDLCRLGHGMGQRCNIKRTTGQS